MWPSALRKAPSVGLLFEETRRMSAACEEDTSKAPNGAQARWKRVFGFMVLFFEESGGLYFAPRVLRLQLSGSWVSSERRRWEQASLCRVVFEAEAEIPCSRKVFLRDPKVSFEIWGKYLSMLDFSNSAKCFHFLDIKEIPKKNTLKEISYFEF